MAQPEGEVREARLMSACAFCLSFASRSLRWLIVASPFVTSPPPCVARRAAISRSLNAWLHRCCPFCIAVAPSIAVAVALPSCCPLPPLLVDCCRFHCHRRVNVHPPLLPLLPLRPLCCACHCRPSPSRHPLPPLLVNCCIFMSIAASPSITVAPLRRPLPSTLSLLRCRCTVPVHCCRC